MADPSIVRFRRVLSIGLAHLEVRRHEINDMNVFPVADGDTGDNMVHTLRAVVEELDRLNGKAVDEIGRDEIVQAVARAALLGARGNSGVILSQVVRGAAEELVSRRGELVDPVLVAAAFARAADAAYDSVREPAEGTMLTVVREMAHRVATDLARVGKARFDHDVTDEEQDSALAELLAGAIEAGEESVERGPRLLPVLREAGVKDAGGTGVVTLLNGVVAGLRGDEALPVAGEAGAVRPGTPHHESSRYRYCTNFVVSGSDLVQGRIVPELEKLGDSVLVVGDASMVRAHVHTDDPETAVDVCKRWGEVSRLEIADMPQQIAERRERLQRAGAQTRRSRQHVAEHQTCGVVVVTAGEGMCKLFEGLGAHVLAGGSTMNPSTVEILAAIHDVHADEVVILPNSSNVIMAAERAADLAEKRVEVVASRSQQAGLACLVELEPDAPAAHNAQRLRAALARVRTGAVAPAARDDAAGRFRRGDAVGFVGDEIVAWGQVQEAAGAVIAALAEEAELITVLAGADAPLGEAQVREAAPVGVEVDLQLGGQPHYWWLLSAE